MRSVLLVLCCLGCAPKVSTPLPPESSAPKTQAAPKSKAIKITGLTDLRCTPQGCAIQAGTQARTLDPVTLALGEPTPAPPLAPVTVTLAETSAPTGENWNRQIASKWRIPFQEQVPTPSGGRVTYMRSMQAGTARLVRFGGGMRAHPAPHPQSPIAYRRWLALHPTGKQAYLAPWPHTEIIAIDPDRLLAGWRLDLGAPTLGLFVDASGQYLVGETGAEPNGDRMLDYSGAPIAAPEGTDPTGDPHMAAIPRPMGTHTFVIDLEQQRLVAKLPGTYLRWVPRQGGVLIATTQAVARLPLNGSSQN